MLINSLLTFLFIGFHHFPVLRASSFVGPSKNEYYACLPLTSRKISKQSLKRESSIPTQYSKFFQNSHSVICSAATFLEILEKWLTRKKSEFAEPLFYTFLEKRLQIKCSSEPSLPIYLYLTAYKYQSYLLAFRIFDETQIPFSS